MTFGSVFATHGQVVKNCVRGPIRVPLGLSSLGPPVGVKCLGFCVMWEDYLSSYAMSFLEAHL